MKAFEDHARNTGEQISHPLMKELLAGFASAEVDKLFEIRRLDFLDRERAKHRAIQQAHQLADEKYGRTDTYNWQGDQYYASEPCGYGGPPYSSGPPHNGAPDPYGGPAPYGSLGPYSGNEYHHHHRPN
ncbi:unnamed protein product [Rotaria sp. Silwood2]|nr:unnamed protein product [Rotaria sp. Silwood2]CAF3091395.1 unnamed protein product [Rotaria sp. Silwood2]CAF3340023.1 unnamed protein product [Rotaria sp. Silwood2]CAF3435953.1 unnamed protein product [Rotaria sp. Silwood2]CAF4374270.1 unnamed protein product [Rotaria sp. Silwood2]